MNAPYVDCYFMHQDTQTATRFWNRIASWYTRSEIIHCELFFVQHQLACVLDAQHPVHFKRRDYTTRKWEVWRLCTNQAQYDAMWLFCCQQQGKLFDWCTRACFPLASCYENTSHQKRWMCGPLMVSALIHARVLNAYVHIPSVTPACLLYDILPCTNIPRHRFLCGNHFA